MALASTMPLTLGATNRVDAPTKVTNLKGDGSAYTVDGKLLTLENTSTGANATALGLNVASGRPPLVVNSGTKVANLNADSLDSHDSSYFLPKAGKAADSDKLDGVDSTGFLRSGGKAVDSDALDGLDSAAFVQGNGRLDTASGTATVGHDLYLFYNSTLPFVIDYSCPANSDDNGTVYWMNELGMEADLFSDVGSANPVYQRIHAGPNYNDSGKPMAASGDGITYQARWTNGRVATIWVTSVHFHNNINPSNSTCQVEAQAVVSS